MSIKFKTLIWAIRQIGLAAPIELCVLSFLILIQGALPAGSLWVTKNLLNWIISADSQNLSLIYLIGFWGGILLAETGLTPFVSVLRVHLNEKVLAHSNLLLMKKANSINGLSPFENPKIYDQIQFLKNESLRRPLNFVYILTGFFKDFVTLLSILIILSSLGWWVPFAFLIAAVPHAISNFMFEKASWDQLLFSSPESRKMAWLSAQTLDEKTSKELRFFGFGDFFIQRFKQVAQSYHHSLANKRWKKSWLCLLLSLASVICSLVIFTAIILEAKMGLITVGGIVVAVQALFICQMQLTGCTANIGMLTPVLLFFEKFKAFLEKDFNDLYTGHSKIPIPSKEIQFENVSFVYPDGRKALSNISFSIQRGERIAIIGENGAGKTTIAKLLARFYDPTEGRILVDGVDLREIDLKAWRNSLSGIFQDFGQYHLSVKENISLSNLTANESEIKNASSTGGFANVVDRLSNGYDSLLGKEFGGTTLSGGEWQKLAMSRAFLRDAQLLILDEPTAALDPKSEYEVFQRFAVNSLGKTAIFITHRLGSVKMVDRLLILKGGELVECGTHDELMRQRKTYFEFFSMQAKSYQEEISQKECLREI